MSSREMVNVEMQQVNSRESDSETGDDFQKPDWSPPWGPVLVVLAVELCERLTYYTLAGSQSTYLKKQIGYTPSSAASLNSVFSMLCYMWCLPGGLWADVVGRYKIIVGLASVYAIGTVITAISTYHSEQMNLKGLFLFGGLILIPLGTGGIKPNICNFGADQIGDETDAQKETQKKFFSYFYMAINVGVMFAFGFLVNVTTAGLPSLGVQKKDGYFIAYIIAACSMTVAVLLFIAGTRCYTLLPGGGIEGFNTMVASVWYSVRNGGGPRAVMCVVGWLCLPVFFAVTIITSLLPAEESGDAGEAAPLYPNKFEQACLTQAQLDNASTAVARLLSFSGELLAGDAFAGDAGDLPTCAVRRLSGGGGGGGGGGLRGVLNNVALALGSIACIFLVISHLNNKWIKPLPKKKATSFTVHEVRAGFATVPLLVVVNLSFNMGYNAMNNAFPAQACQMNTLIGGTQLNGAFFNFGDALAIIVFTPLFESVCYPAIGKAKGSPVRLGQKLVTGLLVAGVANIVAAIMEVKRRQAPLMTWTLCSECAPNGIHMRDMSAFWMFIPFALIGAAEILVNPCMYYFAYTAAPPKVRSLIQAFNLFFNGSVSNAFTAVAMEATFPNDLDTGHLEYYYFLNVVCALVGVLLYFWLTRCGNNGEDIKEDMQEEVDVTERRPTATSQQLQEAAAAASDSESSSD